MTLLPTYASWVEHHGLPDIARLSDEDLVTVSWLQYDQAVALKVAEMREDAADDTTALRGLFDVLSEDIIDSHLGTGWFEKHVDESARSSLTRTYLPFDGPPERRLLAAHRVHDLARRLYQLQSFPWFEDLLARIRTRNFSGASFELDVVFVLHNLVAAVAPNSETGTKGKDYDIHLQVLGVDVPVEVKAKDDDTPFSERTVINTIKGAASQLPKHSKGIVFIRVPTAWTGADIEQQYTAALADATRHTSRIAVVVTAFDEPTLNESRTAGHVKRRYVFTKVKGCQPDLGRVCDHLDLTLQRKWAFFAPSPPF